MATLLPVLILFLYFLQFPEIRLCSKRQKICYSSATFKDFFFSVDELIALLEETRLEIQNLITIVLSWPTWMFP